MIEIVSLLCTFLFIVFGVYFTSLFITSRDTDSWDEVEYSNDGSIRKAVWRKKESLWD